MEFLQDAVVVQLNVTLLGMGFVFLYRAWTEIVAFGDLQEGLSNIIFVVITIEALPALGRLPEVPPGGPEHPRRVGCLGDNPEGDLDRGRRVHHAAADRDF